MEEKLEAGHMQEERQMYLTMEHPEKQNFIGLKVKKSVK